MDTENDVEIIIRIKKARVMALVNLILDLFSDEIEEMIWPPVDDDFNSS